MRHRWKKIKKHHWQCINCEMERQQLYGRRNFPYMVYTAGEKRIRKTPDCRGPVNTNQLKLIF